MTQLTLDALLKGTDLPHLKSILADEDLTTWQSMPRTALLNHLKERGVSRIVERQALANAFSRAQRGLQPEWKAPPPPSIDRKPPSANALAPAPLPPPTPRGTPFFDSAKGVWGHAFNSAQKEASSTAGYITAIPEPEASIVRRELLSATHERRDNLVRIAAHPDSALFHWTNAFGECADAKCGCYRLREPRVRARFRNLVVARTVAQLAASAEQAEEGVRYFSIGCGSLLTDVEILAGLREQGVPIAYVGLFDPDYKRGDGHQVRRLLAALAAFVAPARVVAYGSRFDLQAAAEEEPEIHGRATTVCKIDANDAEVIGMAGRLLVEGGHAFQLSNDGRTKAGRACWRRVAPPTGAMLRSDDEWGRLLERVPIRDDEGFVSPLGVCESAESQAELLYGSADAEQSGRCTYGENSWQNRQWQNRRVGSTGGSASPTSAEKSLVESQGEAELSAALNLL